MADGNSPVYFDALVEVRQLATEPVGKMGGRSVVPIQGKFGQIRSEASCLKAAGGGHAVGDLSTAMRSFSDGYSNLQHIKPTGMAGDTFISLPAVTYIGIGAAGVVDSVKHWRRARDIGDHVGQQLAIVEGVENGLLSTASGAVLGLKTLDGIQDISLATHHTFATTGAFTTAQGVFSWLSGVLFGIYYVVNAIRYCVDIVHWYQGREWRKELMKEKDPMQALFKELRNRSYQIDMTFEEETELALVTGARWLEKVEASSEGKLKIPDKKEAFRRLVMTYPGIIGALIGQDSRCTSGKSELVRFGRYMAYKNLCASFEAECTRKLGSKAVEAMKAGDKEALKKALEVKGWIVPALKVAAAAIGLIAIIAVTIFLSGSPIGVILIVAGIAALAMIFLGDGQALKEHLQNGHFKKRDRAFVYFALALSIISFIGVVTLAVVSGGIVPFIASLLLSAVWLGINIHTARMLWKFDHRRWEVQKVVDLKTYRQFLETNPKDTEWVRKKMREEDQKFVEDKTLQDLRDYEAEKKRHYDAQIALIGRLLTRKAPPRRLEACRVRLPTSSSTWDLKRD